MERRSRVAHYDFENKNRPTREIGYELKSSEFLRISGATPKNFHGSLWLPPSKSYLHRALFVASLCDGESKVHCGQDSLSDDVMATVRVLTHLGVNVEHDKEVIRVKPDTLSASSRPIFVGGSGTSARFAISFAALAKKGSTVITGDDSLSKRPMQPLLDALSSLGVKCHSKDGKLPVTVEGGGIRGGKCLIDGSVSSQFISSLLIACTRAERDCTIEVASSSKLVSEPYIEATLAVLKHFGFSIHGNASNTKFRVKGNQRVRAKSFRVPGDMSSAASLIAVAIAARGRLRLDGVDMKLPQSDAAFLDIARKFGANITQSKGSLVIEPKKKGLKHGTLRFGMKNSPDLVPIIAGLAAATATNEVKVENVGHLRFKESDRLSIISREFHKLGIRTQETETSITIFGSRLKDAASSRKPILLDPESDHRIMMALTVAGISGRFGEVLISDPSCVKKSYPNFVSDVQRLLHQRDLLKIVKRGDV